jgi:hypothetical protein
MDSEVLSLEIANTMLKLAPNDEEIEMLNGEWTREQKRDEGGGGVMMRGGVERRGVAAVE